MGKAVLFLLFIVILGSMITGSGCANIIPPGGGPKDTLPPVLVNAVPKDSALHFTSKKIVLTFDEYVQLDNNMNDNLIVSPYPAVNPIVESKLKTVTIILKDSLQPNTTYSINFGKGLKDVNEGNIAKNFTYVFSTGSKLDEGKLSGNVVVAETGKTDSTLLVVLHSNLSDTSIKKNNPKYLTRLDGKGNFTFRNIAPGTYNAFVLPNDYAKKYNDSTKMFAFLNAPLTIDSSSQTIKFYAYQEVKPTEKKKTGTTSTNKNKKTVPKEIPKLKFTTSLTDGPQDLLSPFEIALSNKIVSFDSSKMILADTNFVRLKGYTFSGDTTATHFDLHYHWEENSAYKIIIQQDAFKDSLGATIAKTDTISFKTRREGDYGSIRLHFNGIDLKRNPVLILKQQDKITNSVPLTSNEWYQKLFKPGDYEINILYDTNKNGVWDPGNYAKKLQPEIVDLIPRKLTIRSNIDNEVDIDL